MTRIGLFLGLLVILVWTYSLVAQVPDPAVAAAAPVPGAGHHYIGIGAETVNPADGSLSFDLPFDPPAGRQISMKFGIRFSGAEQFYLSNQYGGGASKYLNWYPNWRYGDAPWQVGGWSYDLPILTAQSSVIASADIPENGQCPNGICVLKHQMCWGNDGFVFRGLDGQQFSLPIATIFPGSQNTQPFCPTYAYYHGVGNNHGILSSLLSGITVVDPSGTTYLFGGAGGPEPAAPNYTPAKGGSLASSITDRNGNTMTQSANGRSYVDSTGRAVVSWSGIGNDRDTINVAGLGGLVTLRWITTPVSFPTTGYNQPNWNQCVMASPPSSTTAMKVVSEIDLPNGTKYSFDYTQGPDNPYGNIRKITFPDGGYVRYVWGLNQLANLSNNSWTQQLDNGTLPESCNFEFDVPAIMHRYVSFDGTTEVLHQQFSYQTVWSASTNWNSKKTTVSTTDLITGQITTTEYNYSPLPGDTSVYGGPAFAWLNQMPVELKVLYKDGNGVTYKEVNKAWSNPQLLAGEQTISYTGGNPSVGNATTWGRDINEQLINVSEYGFQTEGSYPGTSSCSSNGCFNYSYIGPLKRQTITVYPAPSTWFTWNGSVQPATYSGTHIVNAPLSVTVTDGTGNPVKQTLFSYDQSSLQPSSAINLTSPSGIRANITTAQRLISGSTYATTTYQYYDTGQLYKMTDACGNATCADMSGANHTTTYSYADAYASGTGTPLGQTNAYITSVTLPNTGVAHTETFTWGYTDGQIRSRTDQNGRTTTFQYNDPGLLGRLTAILSPDGGSTTVTYNDAGYHRDDSVPANNTPNFQVSKSITSGSNAQTTTAFDGMGHQVRTILSDPQGNVFTDTAFNGLAQVWKQYNPYRSASDSTYGYKQNNYDTLGRVVSTVMQDGAGSTVSTSYAAPCTTVTDETGRQRKSCTDGLGRLVEVDEPGLGPAGTPGSGPINVGGSGQSITIDPCHGNQYPAPPTCPQVIPNGGTITVTVGGFSVQAGYDNNSTASGLATTLKNALNVGSSPVTATVSGSLITVTAKAPGAFTNYSCTSSSTYNYNYFSGPAFTASCTTLTGGTDPGVNGSPMPTLYTYDTLDNLLTVNQQGTAPSDSSQWRTRTFGYDMLSRLTSASNPESGAISPTTTTPTATSPARSRRLPTKFLPTPVLRRPSPPATPTTTSTA